MVIIQARAADPMPEIDPRVIPDRRIRKMERMNTCDLRLSPNGILDTHAPVIGSSKGALSGLPILRNVRERVIDIIAPGVRGPQFSAITGPVDRRT